MSITQEETLRRRVEHLEAETQGLLQLAAVSVARLEWLTRKAIEEAPAESVAELERMELLGLLEIIDAKPFDSVVAQRALDLFGLTAPDFVPESFSAVYTEELDT